MGSNTRSIHTNLLRLPQAIEMMAISRASFYRSIKDGVIPPQVKLGPNSVAWLSHELETIISARICGYSDDEIKQLVNELITARKSLMENI
ncbi:helix-turn-helix transcriptional regulator [Photobacterium leiognathi]|uniref:helix-turn-helix transcriptional regulator n=1 Tax=Photobacterium leiognathi TaxID=553611 RepID=UPI002981C49E|nr:AlpA family phage regulatory protein [Photobacterium leiognathi]